MSHHYSGPDFGFPQGDARLDLTDLYAFPKPGDADKSILIMNVHPSAVVDPRGPTTTEPFSPEALYELRIDTDGDAVADITYRVRFSSSEDGSQTATLRRVVGAQSAATGDRGQIIVEAAPVSTGRNARVTEAGGYRFFAGWRSDPFFFDTLGALNNMQFTGDDFFTDKDVCSIVLEVPNSALGGKRVGLWARTLKDAGGVWIQTDRGALPLQVAFLVGEERDAYLAGEPAEDSRFLSVFAHAFEHTGGYTPEEARRLAETLLPDVLPFDPTRAASFPGNGRTLTDNAADAFLTVLTNGRVPGKRIAAHSDLLAEFPYLGPPHTDGAPKQEIRLERLTPEYWRVTLDNPPFNIFGPETIPQLNSVITQLETDPKVKVVVFQSAVPDFFLTHFDFTAPLSATTDMPPGVTGLPALPDILVRLSRAPVVSIVSIRGRTTGVGGELSLASDMRFASREKAVVSQWEIGAGLVPGGGPMARLPRLIGRGRALEMLLTGEDISADLAERYGYVNRALPDAELDQFVDTMARRIAGFDKQSIAAIKRLVDIPTLPSDIEIGAEWGAFLDSVHRPQAQQNIKRLMEMGLQTNPDVEKRLPYYTGTLGQ